MKTTTYQYAVTEVDGTTTTGHVVIRGKHNRSDSINACRDAWMKTAPYNVNGHNGMRIARVG